MGSALIFRVPDRIPFRLKSTSRLPNYEAELQPPKHIRPDRQQKDPDVISRLNARNIKEVIDELALSIRASFDYGDTLHGSFWIWRT
jgi:hypothetical protein